MYTIIDAERLRSADRGERPSRALVERKAWTTGRKLLESARENTRLLPIVFADASATSRLRFAALLERIHVRPGETRFQFSHLRPLRGHVTTELKLVSTGRPLSEDFIRPYALVRTPGFLNGTWRSSPLEARTESTVGPNAFLVHVNPRAGFSYERGFDPADPPGCGAYLLRSRSKHVWSAGNCWRMMRVGDVLLFKFRRGSRSEPDGVYAAARVSRLPFLKGGRRWLEYVVDAPLTEQLLSVPIPAQRLRSFVPPAWGAGIQPIRGDWSRLVSAASGPLPLAEPTVERLRLAQRSMTLARRIARDSAFARRMRSLAGPRCAVCPAGVDYRDADILEVAHVRGVADRGPDHPRNALVLCPSHHALFDAGLWTVTEAGEVLCSRRLPQSLARQLARKIPAEWKLDAACVRWHQKTLVR